MNKSIIYTIFYENKVYHCVGNNIKPFLKHDYYIITNSGNSVNPLCTYHKKQSNKENIIGGISELINFISQNSTTKLIILRGFSRAQSETIFRLAKNKKQKTRYKLIGTMNMFDIVPDFVYPIFENNGKYYFQNSYDSLEIDSFYEICEEKKISRIKPLTFTFNKLINVKEYYTIGDEPLVAFQTSKEKYFIGTGDVFCEFIKDIKIEKEILSKEINDFQNEIKLSKSLKSKK